MKEITGMMKYLASKLVTRAGSQVKSLPNEEFSEPEAIELIPDEQGMYRHEKSTDYYYHTISQVKEAASSVTGMLSEHIPEMISLAAKPAAAEIIIPFYFSGNIPEKIHVWAQMRGVSQFGHDTKLAVSFDKNRWIEASVLDQNFRNPEKWPADEYQGRVNNTPDYEQGPVMISDLYDTPAGKKEIPGKQKRMDVRILLQNKTGGNEQQTAAFNSIGIHATSRPLSKDQPPAPDGIYSISRHSDSAPLHGMSFHKNTEINFAVTVRKNGKIPQPPVNVVWVTPQGESIISTDEYGNSGVAKVNVPAGGMQVTAHIQNHPDITTGFRILHDGVAPPPP